MGSITRTIANNLTTDLGGAGGINFKNIIINGDMSIAQRGTSVSSYTSDAYSTVDRFLTRVNFQGTWTISQDTDVPTGQGFATSLKWDCTTADASPAAGDNIIFQQRFEGQNLQYLKKGTANAESLTLSFWVKSNKTGTYIAELFDFDNTRQISKAYTIDSASTWEKKIITFEGDTTGAFNNDNARSLDLNFWLGAGSNFSSGTLSTTWTSSTNANRAVGQVNLADNTANDFYITGVQLEAGTSASDFEFLPFDVNLQRCMRYFQRIGKDFSDSTPTTYFAQGYADATNKAKMFLNFPRMRSAPTATPPTDQNLDMRSDAHSGAIASGGAFTIINSSETSVYFDVTPNTGSFSTGQMVFLGWNGVQPTGDTAQFYLSAEL